MTEKKPIRLNPQNIIWFVATQICHLRVMALPNECPSLLCLLLLLIGRDRDTTVRVQHHLSAADDGHQQEEAEHEEEEEGKTEVHVNIQPGHGEDWRVHVDKSTVENVCCLVCLLPSWWCAPSKPIIVIHCAAAENSSTA